MVRLRENVRQTQSVKIFSHPSLVNEIFNLLPSRAKYEGISITEGTLLFKL